MRFLVVLLISCASAPVAHAPPPRPALAPTLAAPPDTSTWCMMPAITRRDLALHLTYGYCGPQPAPGCLETTFAGFCPTEAACADKLCVSQCARFVECADNTSYDEMSPACAGLFR